MRLRKNKQLLGKPPGIHGQSIKSASHTVRKSKRKKHDMKVIMSVSSRKGIQIQECGRPYYRGCGRTQEQRTLSI